MLIGWGALVERAPHPLLSQSSPAGPYGRSRNSSPYYYWGASLPSSPYRSSHKYLSLLVEPASASFVGGFALLLCFAYWVGAYG